MFSSLNFNGTVRHIKSTVTLSIIAHKILLVCRNVLTRNVLEYPFTQPKQKCPRLHPLLHPLNGSDNVVG